MNDGGQQGGARQGPTVARWSLESGSITLALVAMFFAAQFDWTVWSHFASAAAMVGGTALFLPVTIAGVLVSYLFMTMLIAVCVAMDALLLRLVPLPPPGPLYPRDTTVANLNNEVARAGRHQYFLHALHAWLTSRAPGATTADGRPSLATRKDEYNRHIRILVGAGRLVRICLVGAPDVGKSSYVNLSLLHCAGRARARAGETDTPNGCIHPSLSLSVSRSVGRSVGLHF
jgi:hypothetical protein